MEKKDIIKYTIIVAIVIAIVLLFKNLTTISNDDKWSGRKEKNKETTELYTAIISQKNIESNEVITGSTLKLSDNEGNEIKEFSMDTESYTINDLKAGTYLLEETITPENYNKAESITFEIVNNDINILMYNKPLTEEEIRAKNTESNEIEVENTSSSKNVLLTIIASITLISGLTLLNKKIN